MTQPYKTLAMSAAAALLAVPMMAPKAAAEEVVIGFAGGFSGYLAYFDGLVRQGAEMAVAEINAEGGIGGRHPIVFETRDMRSETAAAAIAARELVSEGAIAMLLPCDIDPAIAAGQLGQAAEIPMIAACASTPILTSQVGEYAFTLKTADTLQAAVLADFAREQGYETAYLMLSPDTPYTDLLPQYFAQSFEKAGGQVLGQTTYSFDQQDFSAEATEIANLDPQPDVIMTSAYEPHFPAFITALRGAGVETPVLGSDGIDSPTTFGIGAAAEGTVFSMAGFPTPGSELESFYRRHEEQYGDYLPFAFSATGYEAIYLLAAAIEAADSLDGAAVRDALADIADYPGVTGTPITFRGQEGTALRDVSLVRVTADGPENLGQFSPKADLLVSP